MNEEQRAISAIYALGLNFNNEVKKDLLLFWVKLALENDISIFELACKNVIKNYKFKTLPPYAIIQEEIDKIIGNTQENKKDEALDKWNYLLELINFYGSHREPTLSEEMTQIVRYFGGWQAICQWEEKHLDFKRKDFLEYYEIKQDVEINRNILENSKIKQLIESKKAIK